MWAELLMTHSCLGNLKLLPSRQEESLHFRIFYLKCDFKHPASIKRETILMSEASGKAVQ